jgi:hypothetical protein
MDNLGERDSYRGPYHERPSFPRKRKSTAPGNSRPESEAIYPIDYHSVRIPTMHGETLTEVFLERSSRRPYNSHMTLIDRRERLLSNGVPRYI